MHVPKYEPGHLWVRGVGKHGLDVVNPHLAQEQAVRFKGWRSADTSSSGAHEPM